MFEYLMKNLAHQIFIIIYITIYANENFTLFIFVTFSTWVTCPEDGSAVPDGDNMFNWNVYDKEIT